MFTSTLGDLMTQTIEEPATRSAQTRTGPPAAPCWCSTCRWAAWPSRCCSRWSRPALSTIGRDLERLHQRRQLGHHRLPAVRLGADADPRPARRHGRQAQGPDRRAGRAGRRHPARRARAEPGRADRRPRAAGRGRRDPAAVDRHRARRAAPREGRRHRRPALGDLRHRRRRRHRGRRPDRRAPLLALAVLAAAGPGRDRAARRDLRHAGVAGPHARPPRRARRRHPVGRRWCRCCWRSARARRGAGATPKTIGLLALGVVALVVFVLVELRVAGAADRHAADAASAASGPPTWSR